MNGKDYVAVVNLYARDKNALLVVVAKAGATCENVDARSLPTLLKDGDIIKSALAPATKEDIHG